MDGCRVLLSALAGGLNLDDVVELDTPQGHVSLRLTRLIRLGLVDIDDDETVHITEAGRSVLAYVGPDDRWEALRATIASEVPDLSIRAFEILAHRIVAHRKREPVAAVA
jgi:hypothetical protein